MKGGRQRNHQVHEVRHCYKYMCLEKSLEPIYVHIAALVPESLKRNDFSLTVPGHSFLT